MNSKVLISKSTSVASTVICMNGGRAIIIFSHKKRKDTKTYRIKIPPAHPRYGLARNGFYDIAHQALVEKIAFAAPANSWHVIRFNKRTFDLTKYVYQAECGHSVCRFRNHY